MDTCVKVEGKLELLCLSRMGCAAAMSYGNGLIQGMLIRGMLVYSGGVVTGCRPIVPYPIEHRQDLMLTVAVSWDEPPARARALRATAQPVHPRTLLVSGPWCRGLSNDYYHFSPCTFHFLILLSAFNFLKFRFQHVGCLLSMQPLLSGSALFRLRAWDMQKPIQSWDLPPRPIPRPQPCQRHGQPLPPM